MIKTETIGGQAVQQDSNALFQALLEAKNQGNSWDIAHWEQYLNTINPDHMALGLDRVREVAFRLLCLRTWSTMVPILLVLLALMVRALLVP